MAAHVIIFLILFSTITLLSAGKQQQEHQQHPSDKPPPSLKILTEDKLSKFKKKGYRFIVLFNPPKQDEGKKIRTHFDSILSQLSNVVPKEAGILFYSVNCGDDPALCLKCIGEITAGLSIIARYWGDYLDTERVYNERTSSLNFEKYDGPNSNNALFEWVKYIASHQVPPPSQPLENHIGDGMIKDTAQNNNHNQLDDGIVKHNSNIEVSSDGKMTQIISGIGNNGILIPQPRRSHSKGIYIYNETWARVLDEHCGVSTWPQTEQLSKDDIESIGEIPLLDVKNSPLVERDAGHFSIMRHFLKQTIDTGLVVDNPDDARWFLIPFDFDRSYSLDKNGDNSCAVSTHLQRVQIVMDGLESSEFYNRNQGRDHVTILMHWLFHPWRRKRSDDPNQNTNGIAQSQGYAYFPHSHMHVVKNMVILRSQTRLAQVDPILLKEVNQNEVTTFYGFQPKRGPMDLVWWIEGEDWRCSVTVPVLTPVTVERMEFSESFTDWLDRPYLLNYRGNGSKKCNHGAQQLHDLMYKLKEAYPGSLIEDTHAPTREEYASELVSSKFCLVLRGDSPSRSKYHDAITAGCIPVLISDGWELTALPFGGVGIDDYTRYTITIPESMFLAHPTSALYYAYGLGQSKLRRMHKAMMENRRFFAWGLGKGNQTAGQATWKAINEDCDFEDVQ